MALPFETRKTGRSNISRSKRRMLPASLPGFWLICPFTTLPSPTHPSKMSSSRRLISDGLECRTARRACSCSSSGLLLDSKRSSYAQNLPTTLASQLGGTVAVPRQPDHVPALLAGLPDYLSCRMDQHCQQQGQCQRTYRQRFRNILPDPFDR